MDAGFVDYYLMAFTLFRHNAASAGIGYWARGAVPSSVVCYCLGLTEIDPIKYGLHSARFVNEEPPKFQFDIEASRYDEFMKMAEDVLQASAAEGYDIEAIREGMLQRLKNITPMEYLSRKRERPLPKNLDDELARYALSFPDTMDLYDAYVQNPQSDFLIYQEQMLDILRQTFGVSSTKANQIRLSIQRRDAEQVEAYKQELFSNLPDLTSEEAEGAWQRLTSNPRAFLKAHAVSHVLASYKYDIL
jgi:DNA polymerase III alpha subunit